MNAFKFTSFASGLLGASVLALGFSGLAPRAASAAPFGVLPAQAVTAETALVQAKFRSGKRTVRRGRVVRSSRFVRPRAVRGYRHRGPGPAAIIGAFGAVAAAAIAAESRRSYHPVYAPGYPVYDPGYGYYPDYGYADVYAAPVPVYGGPVYVRQPRARIYRPARQVWYPRAARPVYAGPRIYTGPRVVRAPVAGGVRFGGAGRAFRGARWR
ncbi:MAG: hypothetical protein AB7F96_00285 [Beijerinckiaceae bacterium]